MSKGRDVNPPSLETRTPSRGRLGSGASVRAALADALTRGDVPNESAAATVAVESGAGPERGARRADTLARVDTVARVDAAARTDAPEPSRLRDGVLVSSDGGSTFRPLLIPSLLLLAAGLLLLIGPRLARRLVGPAREP